MSPYFATNHTAGMVLLIIAPIWGMMELAHVSQAAERARKGATRIGRRSFWLVTALCIVALNVMLYLAPRFVPAAAIRPGAAAFAVGLVILVAGLFSPDGKTLAADDGSSGVISLRHLWNVATQQPTRYPHRSTE